MKRHGTDLLVDPAVLTVRQVAALLRLPRAAVWRAVLTGELPRVRRGPCIGVPTRELLATFGVPLNDTEGGSGDDC